MIDRAGLRERKRDVMVSAARRWKEKVPDIALATSLLRKGGPRAATSPARVAMFEIRELAKARVRFPDIGLERKVGDNLELDDMPPSAAARTAGRPVARLVELFGSQAIGEGFATGFLVAPNLLMTNWHVFEDRGDPVGCGAQFGYERNDAGLTEAGVVYEFDPQKFFLSDRQLDIALVALKSSPAIGAATGEPPAPVKLIPTQGKILVGHPINIIQHPDGRHKHWAVRQNKLLTDPKDSDLFLTYTTDTLEGSSGSPGFNHDWELVTVHHSGVPRVVNGEIITVKGEIWRKGMPDDDIDWIANEGVRVSKIHQFLSASSLNTVGRPEISAILSNAVDLPRADESFGLPSIAVSLPAATQPQNMQIVVNGTANFYLHQPDGVKPANPDIFQVTGKETSVVKGLEKKLKFDPDYENRPGYQANFLSGYDVPPPTGRAGEVLKENNTALVLRYHHYSLAMHRRRRLAIWTAANVDYTESKRRKSRDEFGDDTWKPDPRILIGNQIEDVEFYAPAKKFDRGHLVRRDDVAWGETESEEEYGNSDSFHWTNCTPQHEQFNRDMFQYKGIWGGLENHIAQQASAVDNRLTIFAGPILDDANDEERDFGSGIMVKVPLAFWKVVVVVESRQGQRNLRAYGFILDQTSAVETYGWEGRFRAGKFSEQQSSLKDIADRARVTFAQLLHEADPLALEPVESRKRSLQTLDDVRLR